MSYYIGVDIGGTKCAVVLGTDVRGMRVIDKASFPTETHRGAAYAIRNIENGIDALRKKHAVAIRSIGISCGGPLDSVRGLVLSPPNLPGWDRIAIVRRLSKRYGIPAFLENDANACALAEWRYGAGRGCRNMVFFTFGTGLGAGLILDGRLFRGTNDMAGEAGHIRLAPDGPVGYGKAGSFEGYCSGGGIAQLAAEEIRICREKGTMRGVLASITGPVSAKDVASAASKGDALAKRILARSGTRLGEGLSVIIDVLNPQVIVLGSIYARCERFLRPHAMRVIQKEALARSRTVCRIVPAKLGEAIGDIAALTAAENGAALTKGGTSV